MAAFRFAHAVRDQGHHLVDGVDGRLARAAHHRGIGEHVVVVRDVEAVEAGVGSEGEEPAVGGDRLAVGLLGLLPVAQPHVDVRRHVDVVREAGLEVAEPVGGGLGASGVGRGLDGVDVEVVRQRMVGGELRARIRAGSTIASVPGWGWPSWV